MIPQSREICKIRICKAAILEIRDSLVTTEEIVPGEALKCQGVYQARPKIHVIRVVFQDQAMYARTSFRGAKTCKIGKKGVFLVIYI